MKHPEGLCDGCGSRLWGDVDGANFCADCDVEDSMGPIRIVSRDDADAAVDGGAR